MMFSAICYEFGCDRKTFIAKQTNKTPHLSNEEIMCLIQF